jgi:hypothetical protein
MAEAVTETNPWDEALTIAARLDTSFRTVGCNLAEQMHAKGPGVAARFTRSALSQSTGLAGAFRGLASRFRALT